MRFWEEQAMRRGKGRTDVSMKAHLGIRVPSGTGEGKLEEKIEYRNQWKPTWDLRSRSYFAGAVERPLRVAFYKSVV